MEMKHHINTGCNNNINNDKVITHITINTCFRPSSFIDGAVNIKTSLHLK